MNNKDKLYALAKSLNLKIPTNADVATSKKIIVEALVAGDVIVSVKDKLAAPPKGVTELPITPADVPEVIDSASLIPSITPELLNELNQSAQAVTLIKAAQNKIPFCKECTKAEMQKDEAKSPAKTENKNINSDSNTDTVAVNNSSPATEKTPVSTESIDATAPTDATKTPASTETVDTPVTADPTSITDVGTPPQNTPLTGAAENITTNTAATGSNNADIGESIATIASIATATSAATVLTGNSTAAAVAPITATPTKSPVSSANTEYPETNDSATTTSNSLGTPEQGINNNPASLDSSQVDNSITGISTPEITLTTSGVETSNSANITTNPTLSTDKLTAGKATIDNNIDAKTIATGATATAAAAASSLISNGSGKITGQLKGKSSKILTKDDSKNNSDKVSSKKQQKANAQKKVVVDNIRQRANANPVNYSLSKSDIAKLKSGPKSHTLERHGTSVPDEKLQLRAFTGIAPDGSSFKLKAQKNKLFIPEFSSKFNSDASIKAALDKVDINTSAFNKALQEKLTMNPNATQLIVRAKTNTNLGYGYKAPSVKSVVKGEAAIGPLEKVNNLTNVEAKYVLNKSTKTWELRTMFPTTRNP